MGNIAPLRAASETPVQTTVSTALTSLMIAQPVEATVSPDNSGRAVRNSRQVDRQQAARGQIWSEEEPTEKVESELMREMLNPENQPHKTYAQTDG
ncbi:hypothetical protein OROGR_022216 [Orobanche gracilis]